MLSRKSLARLIVGLLLGLSLPILTPSLANAAGGCSSSQGNLRVHETIRTHGYVIKNLYSSSDHYSCVTVRRTNGRKLNAVLKITAHWRHQATHSRRQYVGVRRVVQWFDTDDVIIDVHVYAGPASRDTAPYRGSTTLLRS